MTRFFLALLLAVVSVQAGAETRNYEDYFFQKSMGDFKAELDTAKAEGKKGVLLIYEQEECPFCHRLHDTIVNQREVQDYYRQHFLVFRFDIKGDNPVVGFDGARATEKAFALANRVRGTPTAVFYGLDGKEITRFTGLPKDAIEFMLLARYVVDQGYRTMPFHQYKLRQVAR